MPGGQTALFQGAWTDPVTGIASHRARWYDSRSANWLSEDPMKDLDSVNRYAFVGLAPHSARDPRGTYGEAGHYYTVLYTALRVGYSFPEAQRLAFYTQAPDEIGEWFMEEHGDASDGWVFQVEEVSAGVYCVRGIDEAGRNIQMTGADPDALLEKCKKSVAELARS